MPSVRAAARRPWRWREKLAGILHRKWLSETDFDAGFGAKVTQRLRLKARAVTAAGVLKTSAAVAPSMLRRGAKIRDPRAVGVPVAGRETGEVRYLLPAAAFRG